MSLEQITDELIARQPPEAQAIIRMLLAHIAAQDRRIAELEARLNKSPQNSSLPPSTQHPHAKSAPPRPKSKKKRGAQPGHVKHERPLLPTDQCDEVHRLKPTECRRCGTKLAGCDIEPWRHQVWELPEINEQLGMDESPTKEGSDKAWLWTAVAGAFTVFGVRLSRAATLLEEWLGEAFTGVITCDRAKMYWSHGRLQWDAQASRLASLDAADPPQGGRLAAARSVQRQRAPARHVRPVVRSSRSLVDLSGSGRD
jgi:hypothetical protein